MKAIFLTAVALSTMTIAASAEDVRGYRLGDPLSIQQRRADPLLDRYPGLTPRESGPRLAPAEQLRQGAPAPKSVCSTVWNRNSAVTACY